MNEILECCYLEIVLHFISLAPQEPHFKGYAQEEEEESNIAIAIQSLNERKNAYAGNITYTAGSHPNSTKLRHRNNMNVNQYKKNTEDSQKNEANIN